MTLCVTQNTMNGSESGGGETSGGELTSNTLTRGFLQKRGKPYVTAVVQVCCKTSQQLDFDDLPKEDCEKKTLQTLMPMKRILKDKYENFTSGKHWKGTTVFKNALFFQSLHLYNYTCFINMQAMQVLNGSIQMAGAVQPRSQADFSLIERS